MSKPYINLEETEEYIIREFDQTIDPHELVWHRDQEDRLVVPLNENNWMIQMDNKLPKFLNEKVFIPKEEFHRVIKGNGNLKVKIYKKSI